MFKYFRSLFQRPRSTGINEDTQEKNGRLIEEIKSGIQVKGIGGGSLAEERDYDITEIKTRAIEIKNVQGESCGLEFIVKYLDSNDIRLYDALRLIKLGVDFMNQQGRSDKVEMARFLDERVAKFSVNEIIECREYVSEAYKKISKETAIDYLKQELENVNNELDSIEYNFNSFLKLSGYYVELNRYDDAFVTLRRAGILLMNNAKLNVEKELAACGIRRSYLWNMKMLYDKYARVCSSSNALRDYPSYLYYEVASFFLEAQYNTVCFPLWNYFSNRKDYLDGGKGNRWKGEYFNRVFESICDIDRKDEFIEELYNDAFYILPMVMGVPVEYLDEGFFPDSSENYDRWHYAYSYGEELMSKQLNVSLPFELTKEVLSKYQTSE